MNDRLLKSVLEQIKPAKSEAREEKKFALSLVSRIQKAAPRGSEAVLTGSIAKGTYLRDAKDIDIFVLFPRTQSKQAFESIIEKIVKKAFPRIGYQLSYAEHPYARFHYEGRKIDLVPAYKIKKASERISAVDRSVLHTRHILKNMKSRQKDDVLLLKKLLKANGLYGAEIKIEGFPGYLCELLILQYGSFSRLISAVNKWALPKVIDLNEFYRTKKEMSTLPEKFSSTLVVIDPTDKNRNVAAALSVENLKKFILLCKYFKKNPSQVFFNRTPKTFEQKVKYLKTKGHTYTITLPKPNIVDDVLWGQIKKLLHQLQSRLEKDGFEFPVFSFGSIVADDSQNKIRIGFSVYDNLLPKTIAIEGPPLDMEKHVKAFRKRHKRAKFIERSERLFAITRRKIRTPEESVKAFFTDLKKTGKSHLAYPLSRITVKKQ
jgi:tRNA nucleotidyltransferase (CCA-adding enzyme)